MTRVHADSKRACNRQHANRSERPQTVRARREGERNAAPAPTLARLNRTHGNQAAQLFVATQSRFGTKDHSDEGSPAPEGPRSDSTAEQSAADRTEERSEPGQAETERSHGEERSEPGQAETGRSHGEERSEPGQAEAERLEGAIEFFEFDEPIPLSMLDWLQSDPHHSGSNDPL